MENRAGNQTAVDIEGNYNKFAKIYKLFVYDYYFYVNICTWRYCKSHCKKIFCR